MLFAILFHFLCVQRVSDINISPHWSYCSCFDVCWSFGVVGLEWYPCCRLQTATRIPLQPNHTETSTHIETRTIRPMWWFNRIVASSWWRIYYVLMSETPWAHKKWNKIANDIKLVFYSSTITMTHGPINIRCLENVFVKRRDKRRLGRANCLWWNYIKV